MSIKEDIATLRRCVDTMQSMRYTPPLERVLDWIECVVAERDEAWEEVARLREKVSAAKESKK